MTVEKEKALGEDRDQLLAKTKKLLEEEGKAGWRLAQETLSRESASTREFREAMKYVRMRMHAPSDYFRPALLSYCSKAVGGTSDVIIPTAASLTLFARAIGIQDDIIDQSKVKNKHLTIPGKFGKDMSLILSDVLLFKGFTLLRKTLESRVPMERVVAILDVIERIWFEQSEGEILEIQSQGKTDITPEECLAKIEMRASEIEACTRIGGILGGGLETQVETLGRYGRLLGMMSILRNELIDMLEFKVLRHRIRKESLPLPLVYALQNPRVNSRLVSLISKKKLTAKDSQEISRLVDEGGGIEYVASLIEKMFHEAHSCINMFKDKSVYSPLKSLIATLPIQPDEWRPILQKKAS